MGKACWAQLGSIKYPTECLQGVFVNLGLYLVLSLRFRLGIQQTRLTWGSVGRKLSVLYGGTVKIV